MHAITTHPLMKRIFSILVTLAFAAIAHAELTVISFEYRDADSFKRISEYLTGKHSDGRYAVYRSDETIRDGFYVSLLADKRATLSSVATVNVQFVRSGTQATSTFQLPAGSLRKKRILVGFTGGEWTDPQNHPVAWKIDLLDANGTSLDSAQSFLWSDETLDAPL